MSARDGNNSNTKSTANNTSITGSQVNNRGVNGAQPGNSGALGDTSLSSYEIELSSIQSGFKESSDNNLRILYITFAIIIGLLLLWIIIVVFTKENPLKILGEMNNLATQIPPASDIKSTLQLPISSDTMIVPEGYFSNSSVSTNNNMPLPI